MESDQEEAFKKVIPKFILTLENKENLDGRYLYVLKKEIRKELSEPNISIYKKDIARFVVIYLIKQGIISNREDLLVIHPKYGFINKILEKYELDSILESYIHEEYEDDDFSLYNQEYIQKHYLNDDPDWFLQMGLKENPFPSQDGLYLISKDDYEAVVLKTPIYQKYIEILDQEPKWILNKSIIVYGDFGCGKTTFFDYLGYKLLLKNIQPIRIILNARPSLSSLHQSFNESLFNELATYISKYSSDPRGNNSQITNYNILSLFERIQKDRDQKGFVIFLDGLHKSQDQKSTALNFLIEMQNILEFYRRKEISLTIFVAGSLEWRDKINISKKFSGSIFTLEKMDPLNVNQSYEMLKRRFAVFSEKEDKKYIKYNEIELLVTSIQKTLATDINFRILIKYFLQNGFIFKNRIKIKPFIEEDVLNNIYEAIKNNKILYNNLIQMKEEFKDDKTRFSEILYIISTTYDMGYFFDDHSFYRKYKQGFDYLLRKNIIIKSEKYKKNKTKPYALNQFIYSTFKDIENKVKFRPTHYFELLFIKEPEPMDTEADYIKILETIRRFKENNPELEDEIDDLIHLTQEDYFALINEIEKTPNFHISEEVVIRMNNIVESLLNLLYELSGEVMPINTQTQLFQIFKYTWLDNQVLTQYFTWSEGWNPNVDDKKANMQYLKLFIDTYESLIFKIGKHILYNKILIIGSKNLNNNEKIALNSARAFYSVNKYKDSIEKCHDLIENTLRTFIFNILFIKYGNNWEAQLPNEILKYINKIKRKEKKRYGRLLLDSGNSLFYLTRSSYSIIIDDDYLWENCFSILFGEAYRSYIKESLDTLANLGHLDKHNRNNKEIGRISGLIQQNLSKAKDIIEKINEAYRNLITLKSFIIKKSEIIPRFHHNETIDKLESLPLDASNCKSVLEIIKQLKMDNKNIIEDFIKISEINYIIGNLSMTYRNFIASIIYLIQNKKVLLKDYYGSNLIFEN